jgi:hypothetical protein
MLLIFMGVGAFIDNFMAVFQLLAFPFVAIGETGRRIFNKITDAFDGESSEY